MSKTTPSQKPAAFKLPQEAIAPSVPTPQAPRLSLDQAIKIAEQHHGKGELQQAEGILRQILAAKADYAPALHLLGIVAHSAGKPAVAIDLIEKAIKADGKVALYHANIAEMHRREKNLEAAVRHGQRAVALNPKMASALGNLGIAYYDSEEYAKARECHEKALAINPKFAPSLNNIGSILRKENLDQEAHDYFQAAIDADANYLDAYNNLGEILTRLEQPEEALKVLDKVLRANPRFDSAHSNMGMAFLALGNEVAARNAFARAITVNPDCVPAYAGLTLTLIEFHRDAEAADVAGKLIALEPSRPDGYSMLGTVYNGQGKTEDAVAMFEKALSLDPDYIPAKAGMGHVLMEKGDMKGAENLFRECMNSDESGDVVSPALYSLVQVKKVKEGDPEIALLEKDAERLKGKLVDSKAIALNFALGKMYDDLGQYDKGFPYYIEGCRIKRKSFEYSMDERQAIVDRVRTTFTKELIEKNAGQGSSSTTPIFVLGMPRSGTTLTEQIIASHPSVYGAGELRDIVNVLEAQGRNHWTELAASLAPGDLARMGDEYVSRIRRFSADAPHITDKMPGNFNYVGMIHLMLPQAKIVHVNRHPLDTCISCFTRLFAHGQYNTYDLAEVGHAYKCYTELMDHWASVLPAGSFYNIQYENIVDDTEGQARALIDYCGLEWDDACLEFYKLERSVRTASVTQVRQPIYKSSKARWKNYEKFIGPMIEALGPEVRARHGL